MVESETAVGMLLFGLLLLVVVSPLLWHLLKAYRLRKAWSALPDALGFTPSPHAFAHRQEVPALVGTRFGREAAVFLYRVGGPRLLSGYRGYGTDPREDHGAFTGVQVAAPRADPRFTLLLLREGVRARVRKRLGWQDLQVGDPAFDGRFLIQAKDEAAARAVLTDPHLREALLALERVEWVEVALGRVRLAVWGYRATPAFFEEALVAATRIAERVERPRPVHAPPP